MNDNEFDLPESEREALSEMRGGPAPPPHLEQGTVEMLSRRGLLESPHRPIRWLAAAAILIVFAVGMLTGRSLPSTPEIEPSVASPRFILLLYESAAEREYSQQNEERLVREYRNWAIGLNESGIKVVGTKLTDDLWSAKPSRPAEIGSDALTGFFVIEASDIERAMEVAKDCPHLVYGGSVVVRRVDET